jgi:hypothetical protein
MGYIANGHAEVSCQLDIPGDEGPAFVVFGVAGDTLTNAPAIADALETIFAATDGWDEMYTTDTQLSQFTVRYRVDSSTVQIAVRDVAVTGDRGGGQASPQVCTLLTKESGLAGRQNRGRMYMPPLTDSVISTAGIITEADRLLVQAGADAFLTDLAVTGIPMVILHTNPALSPTTVSSMSVQSKVATQRRRLR